MAGPLSPVPGYNPGAGGGDPFLHAIGKALLNVATLGESQHPGSLRQYGNEVAQSFDPRHPANWLNIAGIVVPGLRRDEPTVAQKEFLGAIRSSSMAIPEWNAQRAAGHPNPMRRPVYERGDPGVQALTEVLGEPASSPARHGPSWRVAENPLIELFNRQGAAAGVRLGLTPGRGQPYGSIGAGGGWTWDGLSGLIGPRSTHPDWLNLLMQKNAIYRRN